MARRPSVWKRKQDGCSCTTFRGEQEGLTFRDVAAAG
jgi:hypothetical protein